MDAVADCAAVPVAAWAEPGTTLATVGARMVTVAAIVTAVTTTEVCMLGAGTAATAVTVAGLGAS